MGISERGLVAARNVLGSGERGDGQVGHSFRKGIGGRDGKVAGWKAHEKGCSSNSTGRAYTTESSGGSTKDALPRLRLGWQNSAMNGKEWLEKENISVAQMLCCCCFLAWFFIDSSTRLNQKSSGEH